MKAIVFVVAGLLVGTLGGTAFRGMRERDVILARMAQERAAAEAAAAQEETVSHEAGYPPAEPSEEGGEGAVPADSLPQDGESALPTEEGMPEGEEGSSIEPTPQEVPTAADAGSPFSLGGATTWAGQTGGSGDEGPARLAKIFGAMEAKDAAAVLEKLEDQEISAILFHLSDRKAAEILGKFSPERAATLSRSVLGSRNGNGT